MEESKENKEPTSVEIEQVFQNYLIDPDYFTSNFEKAATTLSEVKLPLEQLKLESELSEVKLPLEQLKLESDKSNNFISENISTKNILKLVKLTEPPPLVVITTGWAVLGLFKSVGSFDILLYGK